jgi:hypothetical protein
VCTIIETLEHLSRLERTVRALSKVVREGGFIVVGAPDDCMRPEEFDEHMCSFTMETLRGVLSRYFTVDAALSVEADGKKYVVMRGRKGSHLRLILGYGISGGRQSTDRWESACFTPDQACHVGSARSLYPTRQLPQGVAQDGLC